MSVKRLAMIASAGALLATPVLAQAIVNAPARPLAVAPVRAQGAELRRVTAQDTRLIYEYQTGAGLSRISIDAASLVNDIERARKRAPKAVAARHVAPAAAPAPLQEVAPTPAIARASMVEAAPADAAPEPREARKVRVIPLYNAPKLD